MNQITYSTKPIYSRHRENVSGFIRLVTDTRPVVNTLHNLGHADTNSQRKKDSCSLYGGYLETRSRSRGRNISRENVCGCGNHADTNGLDGSLSNDEQRDSFITSFFNHPDNPLEDKLDCFGNFEDIK